MYNLHADEYEGMWQNDKRSGHGIHTLPRGTKWEGSYYDDEEHGVGLYTGRSGEKILWEYSNGLFARESRGAFRNVTDDDVDDDAEC